MPLDETNRPCGDCNVCCVEVTIEEMDSPAGKPCRALCPTGCSLFGKKERPKVCESFNCGWRYGMGEAEDRPDKVGVMMSINDMDGQTFAYALETRRGAIRTTGKRMVLDFARKIPLPIIVRDAGTPPPNDTGDYVIIHAKLLPHTRKMRGKQVYRLTDDVRAYELTKQ